MGNVDKGKDKFLKIQYWNQTSHCPRAGENRTPEVYNKDSLLETAHTIDNGADKTIQYFWRIYNNDFYMKVVFSSSMKKRIGVFSKLIRVKLAVI